MTTNDKTQLIIDIISDNIDDDMITDAMATYDDIKSDLQLSHDDSSGLMRHLSTIIVNTFIVDMQAAGGDASMRSLIAYAVLHDTEIVNAIAVTLEKRIA